MLLLIPHSNFYLWLWKSGHFVQISRLNRQTWLDKNYDEFYWVLRTFYLHQNHNKLSSYSLDDHDTRIDDPWKHQQHARYHKQSSDANWVYFRLYFQRYKLFDSVHISKSGIFAGSTHLRMEEALIFINNLFFLFQILFLCCWGITLVIVIFFGIITKSNMKRRMVISSVIISIFTSQP